MYTYTPVCGNGTMNIVKVVNAFGDGSASRHCLFGVNLIMRTRLMHAIGMLFVHTQGMHCEADLLADGWIQWQGQKFSSPYAWASQCKNDVNPNHKSGIGWGHVSAV